MHDLIVHDENGVVLWLTGEFDTVVLSHETFQKLLSNHLKATTMKKNVLVFVSLCILCLFARQAQAVNVEHPSVAIINTEDNVPTGYEAIFLEGKLSYSAGPNDIVAGASKNSVYLHFNQSFGNVSISIFNAEGNLVYNSVVDTSMQRTIIIPIMGNSDGTFSVVLDNAFGDVEGDFRRNE